jgi:carbon-monoxide dehydrogenase large subunit
MDMPGVLAVYTGADLERDGLGHIPCNIPVTNRDGTPRADTPRPALAVGAVRHVGDPVAVVIAETKQQAVEAAEMVLVDYDDHTPVIEPLKALEAGAPQVWDHVPGNVCFDWEMYDKAATDKAFERAAHTVTLDIVNNRLVVNAVEPRAILAAYDADADHYTVYVESQGTLSLRRQFADAILKVPEDKVRVVTPDVGGGFGMKLFFYPEYAMAAYAAGKLRRPVKWTGERTESFLSDTHGRGHNTRAELALDEDGRFLAVRVDTVADLGAYLSNAGPLIPTMAYVPIITQQYAIPAIHTRVRGVFTHTVPVDAYRGAGRPEATYLMERLVEAAATQLGMDSGELRSRNFVRPEQMPYTTPTGLVYDSGDFAGIMAAAKQKADWDGFEARKADALKRGKRAGIGMACYVEMTGGAPDEAANIVFNEDDTVSVFVGTLSTGQGHETAFAQLVAARLGVDFDRVLVRQGDSDTLSMGGGTGGSRSLHLEGGAIVVTTDEIIEKGKQLAAHVLETSDVDVEFADGRFAVAGTDLGIDIMELARVARDPARIPDGMDAGLDTEGRYTKDAQTFPNGCHICEVEVDEETGVTDIVRYTVVDDFGNVVNPMLVEGQVHGGVSQGLGQSMFEHTVFDADGQLLSGSFMDYCMPRADDIPAIDFTMRNTPCETNLLGSKGCGEAGAICAPAASIAAVENALAPLGIRTGDIQMPATPLRVWQAIQRARAA